MSSDFDQNSDNELPDWLQGMGSGDEDADFDSGDLFESQSSDDEDVPEWLQGIRSAESQELPTFMDEEVPDEDTEAWLDDIRSRHKAETDTLKGQTSEEEDHQDGDFIDKIRQLKDEEDTPDESDNDWGWDSQEEAAPQDEIAATWMSDTGALPGDPAEEEDNVPDWLSGLPSLDPVPVDNQQDNGGDNENNDLPHVSPLSDPPPDTGSLPTWLENLQTSGLVLPEEENGQDDENYGDDFGYSDEDVSSLLSEADDLPDWIGEGVEDREEEEEPELESLLQSPPELSSTAPDEQEIEDDTEIEKAELPTWLQAMRPVETIVASADIEEEDEDEDNLRIEEKVGPLSGLRDVLPAEPHVVHFGEQAKPVPGFTLTSTQQRYAKMLKSMVDQETENTPTKRRSVALPQQILRWIIATILIAVLTFVLWLRVGVFEMPLAGIPQENLAVINTVNTLTPGETVLVAFEYQPALSGEMESVSAGIIHHLLSRQVNLVLFSSQPTGPGLANAFLNKDYLTNAAQLDQQIINLGYLSGGSAALLNFASTPRRAMPMQDPAGQNLWDQAPLAGINTAKDFALVLVITDDPDMARSWVEQVQPILNPNGDASGTPLVMAVSAQAEPLVYPYYITSPQQINGYVSGLSGGAFYETINNTHIVANRYWNAYNVGLLLTVLVIGLGAAFNLVQQTIRGGNREKA